MNIAIVALAKNEEFYIEEWLDYYRKLGVSKFYIFDNNEVGNNDLQELLKNVYDVELIDAHLLLFES